MSSHSNLDVVACGGGRFAVDDGSRRRTAYAVRTATAAWVFLEGRVYVIQSPGGHPYRDRRRQAVVDDDAALAAPMPATVVSVHVDVGQQVRRGDVLITLEAMKMELAVRAPRDGIVQRVACQPGELVQSGVPLVVLE